MGIAKLIDEFIAGDSVWTNLRVKNFRATKSQGSPHFCEFYFQKLDWVLTVNIGQKSPHASGRGRGKAAIWNMPEHSFLKEVCSREKLARVQPDGDLSEPNWPGKGNTQLQQTLPFHMGEGNCLTVTHSSIPTPFKWDRRLGLTKKHLRGSQSRGTVSLKDWDLIIGPQITSHTLITKFYHILLKVY